MKAILRNYRQSPRKVRLIADLVRGKKIDEAITLLTFTPKRAAKPVKKLLESALANARNTGIMSDLLVKEITVDEGSTLTRYMMRARGSVAPIKKRTSHVSVVLSSIDGKEVVKQESVEETASLEETKKAPKASKKAVKSTKTKKVTKAKKAK